MPSIQEVSFYHDCGHTENLIWTLQKPQEWKLRLPPEVPIIDWERFTGTLEEGYLDDTLEIHYQTRACPSCRSLRASHKLTKLSAKTIQERRYLWWDFTYSFKLQWRYICMVEVVEANKLYELGEEEERYCNLKLLQESKIAKQTCKDNLKKLRWKRKLYGIFNTLNQSQYYCMRYAEERVHLLAPGWDTEILAIKTGPTKESETKEDDCTICFTELYSGDRVRSLPCGHAWHHGCITQWLQQQTTCPMCRKQYNIMKSPDWSNWKSIKTFRTNLVGRLKLNSVDDSEDEFIEEYEDEERETNSEEGDEEISGNGIDEDEEENLGISGDSIGDEVFFDALSRRTGPTN